MKAIKILFDGWKELREKDILTNYYDYIFVNLLP